MKLRTNAKLPFTTALIIFKIKAAKVVLITYIKAPLSLHNLIK